MVDYYYTNAVMGERPEVTLPNKEFLIQLTTDGFKQMINSFYEIVIESDISHFFPDDEKELELIKNRNGSYFMMMCGGDDTYIKKFSGTFDQIKTHEMFSIPNKVRIQWLGCWEEVLKSIESEVEDQYIQSYWNWLEVFSKHIVNYENDKRDEQDLVKI